MIRPFGPAELFFLIESARWTVLLTAIAIAMGGVAGLLIALARVSTVGALRACATGFIAVVQGVPVLMLLFLSYFGLSTAGFELPALIAASISLSVYASAYLGEIWRGSIQSVPRQQWEASASLGLTKLQQYRYVILPQSIRIAIPPTVGFIVQLVKNTSIVSIVGVVELTRAAQLMNNATFQPFKVFMAAAAIYLVICYPLSWISRRMEGRLNVGRGR